MSFPGHTSPVKRLTQPMTQCRNTTHCSKGLHEAQSFDTALLEQRTPAYSESFIYCTASPGLHRAPSLVVRCCKEIEIRLHKGGVPTRARGVLIEHYNHLERNAMQMSSMKSHPGLYRSRLRRSPGPAASVPTVASHLVPLQRSHRRGCPEPRNL